MILLFQASVSVKSVPSIDIFRGWCLPFAMSLSVLSRDGVIRGRLAPSPTGNIHLGNAWAFMLAWLAARQAGGKVLLRMEDIDPDRARPEYAEGIMADLRWLGLDWDEGPDIEGPCGPYVQSRRVQDYARVLDVLATLGAVYPCYCTRKELRTLAGAPHPGDLGAPYPGTCRNLTIEECSRKEKEGRRPAMRLRWPDGVFAFDDGLFGPQQAGGESCGGDFALRRSDGVFAYQLAVVVDDIAMGVTQVVRGADLLSCTPRQLALYSLLGAQPPAYLHVPLLLDATGERLAKRHQSLEIRALRNAGVPAANITGYLAMLAGMIPDFVPRAPKDCVGLLSTATLPTRPLVTPADILDRLKKGTSR